MKKAQLRVLMFSLLELCLDSAAGRSTGAYRFLARAELFSPCSTMCLSLAWVVHCHFWDCPGKSSHSHRQVSGNVSSSIPPPRCFSKQDVLQSLELDEQFELQSRWVAKAIASSYDGNGCTDQGGILPAVDHMVDTVEGEIQEHEKNDSLRSA